MAAPSSVTEPGSPPPLCASAPLLLSLLPFITGILLARWEGFGPLLLIPAMGLAFCSPFRLVLPPSLLAGYLLTSLQSPSPDPAWQHQPPRERTFILQVEETFNARKPGYLSGTGRILPGGSVDPELAGRLCAFYLEDTLGQKSAGKGDVVLCRAAVTLLPFVREPNDYETYLLNRSVFLNASQGAILERIRGPDWLERRRREWYEMAGSILGKDRRNPDAPGNVLASMLLGDRAFLSDERLERYRSSGTYHLFAVSGLHVGTFALCLYGLIRLLSLPRRYGVIPVLLMTWGYIWLTGASPSAVRAGIMLSCLSLARSLLRQPHPFPALVVSAWMVLLLEPGQLFQLGFQLSYGVVAALILMALPLRPLPWASPGGFSGSTLLPTTARRAFSYGWRGLTDLGLISVHASLVSMPLIIDHFQLFTPIGVVFGMILNPLVSVAIASGVMALLVAPLAGGGVGAFIAGMAGPSIRLMEWILDAFLRLPGAYTHQRWACPGTGTILVLLSLLLAWILQRSRMNGRRFPIPVRLLPQTMIVLGLLAFLRPVP